MTPLAPWLPYPVIFTGVFVLFGALHAAGAPLVAATYLPVLAAAAAVTVLEARLPHRPEWRPTADELKTDLTFMGVVQLATPPLVGFFFAYLLLEPARALNLPTTALWPHGWPVWIQAVLMVLAVDFLRYWLHRFAHENDTLWKLHAVHHSVERLYWVNTARFHPLEKTLQMCLDSLPFLLMGVDARVLSLYYIAYATNGFFQHCNIRLRYGFLNYVVGSAETHRWHHSRVPKEANANYGNTVIIWDLLFGTWYLPTNREIAELGLHEHDYPRTFLGLMRAPFRRSSTSSGRPEPADGHRSTATGS
jgi:ornithine lipid hydroxylase